MSEFYPEIRLVHIAAIVVMGVLFLLRGLMPRNYGNTAWLRYLTYAVDTVWLTAALMLMTILQQYPFVDAWLTVKLLLVLLFLGLRMAAFAGTIPPRWRLSCWIGGLATYAFIVSVARTHDPWGVFGTLAG